MKLNYREKVLLYFVIFFVTIFAGYMIMIKPQIEDIKSNKNLIVQKQEEKADTQKDISQIPALQAELDKLKNNLSEKNVKFMKSMTNPEMDEYLYNISKKSGIELTFSKVGIKSWEYADLKKYDPFADQNVTTAQASTQTTVQAEITKAEYQVVSVEFKTDKIEKIFAFIDTLDSIEQCVVIDKCSLSQNTSSTNAAEKFSVSMEIRFYTIRLGE